MTPKNKAKRKEKFLISLEKNYGVLNRALVELKMCYRTYKKYRLDDTIFGEDVDTIMESASYFVESQLFQLINSGYYPAISFYLSRKGKQIGYVEKQEIEQSITYNKPLELNVIELNSDGTQILLENKDEDATE